MEKEIQEIKKVVEEAYIRGMHGEQDRTLIDGGFHPEFEMLVLEKDEIKRVNVDEWLPRISAMKDSNPALWSEATNYSFKIVDAAGTAGVAKLEVYKGDQFFSVDYMLLYKIEGKWQIVSKVFSVERESHQ
jgi:hypothetical protein